MLITDLKGQSEPLAAYKDLEINEEINGEFSLSFTTALFEETKYVYPLVQEESIVEWEGYEFRIKNVNSQLNTKRVSARSTFFDIIDNQIETLTGGTKTAIDAMRFALSGTGWTFETQGNMPYKLLENFGESNSLALVRQLCSFFECEIKIMPNKRLILASEIGVDDDFQFRYKHNIKSLSQTTDTTNLTTCIKGYGADGLTVEYRSPNVSVYGVRWAEPIEDDRFTIADNLLDHIKQNVNDVPEVSIEIEESSLGAVRGLGDKVWIIHEPMGIEFQTRIFSKKIFPMKPGSNSYTIGNKATKIDDILTETRITIDENRKEFHSRIEQTNDEISLQVERLDGSFQEAYSKITVNADKISLVVSESNKINATSIASEIALTPSAINIMSSNINLTGRVNFNSFDSNTQNTLNTASTNATSALTLIGSVTTYNPYSGSTVIDGNKIYTDYLSSISANLGSVTIGILSSTDSKSRLSLQAGNLQVSNTEGYVQMNPSGVTGYDTYGRTNFGINSRVAYSAALSTSNYNVYLGSKGEARIVDYSDTEIGRDGNENSYTYRNLRCANINAYTIKSYGEEVATQKYVSQNGGYKSGADAYFSGVTVGDGMVSTDAVDARGSNNNIYVRGSAVRCTARGSTSSYVNCIALGYPGSSFAPLKTNIRQIEEDMLPTIMNTKIFNYHFKSDVDSLIFDRKKIGMIWEMVPYELRNEDGIEAYTLVSVLWKGVQEQQLTIDSLKKEQVDLETILGEITSTNQRQEETISMLMNRLDALEANTI